jgi:hypothetical protein
MTIQAPKIQSLLLTSAPHTHNYDVNDICGHILPIIKFTITAYCYIVFYQFITLANKTCKIPEDSVRTLKHVGVILILILYYLHVHLLVY